MPSEERRALALEAVRSRIEQFQSALTITTNQVRGLLASSDNTEADNEEALGQFAKGKVNMERFNAFAQKAPTVGSSFETPVRAAEEVLKSLLDEGDELFIIRTEEGKGLGHQLSVRLASIGRAFAAARIVDLAKNGAYKEDKHASTLHRFPYAQWNSSERTLAPALIVEVSGADFKPSAIVPLLDTNMKIVFNVTGDAPAGALSRVISPRVFVQQEIADARLDAFADFDGIAVAAFLPSTAVSFLHDPSAGSTTYERFVSIEFPSEVRKRQIGGISPAQQAEDYSLLESLSVPPEIAGEATSDPAGKLSAWLLSQTDLSGLSA
ncbi:MAG: hypothetical protein GY732_18530 [Gammaproteobacteria bacterium]|nr:hypothetical protein [Gammaproteobacteria bacterium]